MPFPECEHQVSIVVPTYNEQANVCPLYDAIHLSLARQWRWELVFVDDNSHGTAEEVRRLPTHGFPVKLLERPAKLGLGSTVVEGFQVAQGDFWVMMDGDLSHRPEDLPGILYAFDHAEMMTFLTLCWRLWLKKRKDCHPSVDRHSSSGFTL